MADVLNDHVDVDAPFGQRFEKGRRHAGLIGHASHGDLGLGPVVCDPSDDGLLQGGLLDPRTGTPVERRSDVYRYVVPAADLDRPGHQDAGSRRGQFQHLVEGNLVEFFRTRHDPRVAREDPVDVGVDLADIGPQDCGQGDGGGIGAAPPDGRDFLRSRVDSLKTGHDHNLARIQTLLDPIAPDLLDPGRPVGAVGEDAGLATRSG